MSVKKKSGKFKVRVCDPRQLSIFDYLALQYHAERLERIRDEVDKSKLEKLVLRK